MPRNSSGVYTLPIAAYVAGTTIRSADMNSNLSDIASALTLSLATNGVSSMTGPVLGAAGSVGAPSYSFSGAITTGFYLAGANQIGIATAGVLAATINANGSTSWVQSAAFAAAVTIGTTLGVTGAAVIGGALTVTGDFTAQGTGTQIIGNSGAITNINNGVFVISTASVNTTLYFDTNFNLDPATPAAGVLRSYNKADVLGAGQRPYAKDEAGYIFPLIANLGQCRLTKSGASLVLIPYQGNRLLIRGTPQLIPDAGVTLAASNTASTFVYIYAYMNSSTMTLEMSTTAPTQQPGTGMYQKTGDITRTLVGAAYTDTGGAWADTDGKLWVISYFNRKPKLSKMTMVASLNSAGTTAYVEVDTGIRNQFINWSDEAVQVDSMLEFLNSSAGAINFYAQNNIDGATSLGSNVAGNQVGSPLVNGITIKGKAAPGTLTEAALHYSTLYVRQSSGAAFICPLTATAGEATFVLISVQG